MRPIGRAQSSGVASGDELKEDQTMSSRMKLLALAAALSAMAGAGAYAQSNGVQEIVVHPLSSDREAKSEKVSYADLDISNAAGARTLLLRISGAAKAVCEPAPTRGESNAPYNACVKSAEDRAVADVNQPAVSDLYQHGG
jgi:UrcA family protein